MDLSAYRKIQQDLLTEEKLKQDLEQARKIDARTASTKQSNNTPSVSKQTGSLPKLGIGFNQPTVTKPQPLPYAVSSFMPQVGTTSANIKTNNQYLNNGLPLGVVDPVSAQTYKDKATLLKAQIAEQQKNLNPYKGVSSSLMAATYTKPVANAPKGVSSFMAPTTTVAKPVQQAAEEQKLANLKGELAQAQNAGYMADYSQQWIALSQRPDAEAIKQNLARMATLKASFGTDYGQNVAAMNEYQRIRGSLDKLGINAEGLADWLQRNADYLEAAQEVKEAQEFATERPVLASIKSIGQNLVSGQGGLQGIAQQGMNTNSGEYRPINIYGDAFDASRAKTTIRGAVGENIAKNHGQAAKFLYDIGMSMGDSGVVALTGGLTGLGGAASVILGSAVASDTMMNVVERGGSTEQAVASGLLAGAAETVFESISLGKFLDTFKAGNAHGLKAHIKNILLQGTTEMSEEMATEIANIITDDAVMGSLSELNQMRANGATEADINKEIAKRVALAGLGGFLSGGVFGGVGSISNRTFTSLREQRALNALSEKTGVKIQMDDDIEGSNGYFDRNTNTLHISRNSNNAVYQVAAHEIAHFIESNPAEWQQLYEIANANLSEDARSKLEYVLQKTGYTDAEMQSEVVSHYVQQCVTDIKSFEQLVGVNRTLAQRIVDAFESFVRKLTGQQSVGNNSDTQYLREIMGDITPEQAQQTLAQMKKALSAGGEATGEGTSSSFYLARDNGAIAQAEQMERDGATRDEIWKATGVIRDTKGNWVSELDDSNVRVNRNGDLYLEDNPIYQRYQEANKDFEGFTEKLFARDPEALALYDEYNKLDTKPFTKRTLEDYVAHSELFDLYPDIKKARFGLHNLGDDIAAYYNPFEHKIAISKKTYDMLNGNDLRKEEAVRTIIHEIQHAIQEYDRRPSGASIAYWEQRGAENPREMYRNTAGEIEARETESRRNMPAEQRRKTTPDLGWDRAVFAEDTQKSLKLSDSDYLDAVNRGDTEAAQKMVDEAAKAAMPDSKIKDESGNLRVVYHGTNTGDFTEFNPDYIGMSSGDDGFFGMGFYFAYSKGEAAYYGAKRIIPAYLNLKNPFNFDRELQTYNGKKASGGDAPNAVALMNFADKFPEIAKDVTISVVENGNNEFKDLPISEFAKAFKDVIENKSFEYQEMTNEYGDKETLVLADPEIHEYEYNGVKRSYKDYGFQKRFWGEANELDVAYEYLSNSVYNYVDMMSRTRLILDNNREFTAALKKMGYDGTIQSEYGDEAVAFDPAQIKSADPVTYDDNGDVIPLWKRFDPTQPDIRFSRKLNQEALQEMVYRKRAGLPYAPGYVPKRRSQQLPYAPGYRAAETPVETVSIPQANNLPKDTKSSYLGNTVGAAQSNPESYAHLQNQYGTIEPGENPSRVVDVPKKDADGNVVSLFSRTGMESQHMPDELVEPFEQAVASGEFSHVVWSDKRAKRYAEGEVNKGFDHAWKQWRAVADGTKVATKDDIALGELLLANAMKDKQIDLAIQLTAELCAEATRAGQNVQAFRLLKKMTPQGQLFYLQKVTDKLNKQYEGRKGFEGIKLNEENVKELTEATTKEAMDKAVDKIKQDIADQTPVTFEDKWNAWRYLAMLGNVRTQVRNIMGNLVFLPVVKTKNLIATGIERAAGKRLPERTKALLIPERDKALISYGKNDFENVKADVAGGNKYTDQQDILSKRRIFKLENIERARIITNEVMEWGDRIFSKGHYATSLASYMKANKLNPDTITPEQLNKARNYAIKEAQKATFRDANAFASFLNATKKNMAAKSRNADTMLGKVGWKAAEAVAEGIVPFTKTPANIMARGIEYSPVGLLWNLATDGSKIKSGKMTAAEAIDKIAAGLTGTGLFALGCFLASAGAVTGAAGDDKEDKYNAMLGEQEYALKVGDGSYTIDWLAPAALPFFTGVAVYNELAENGKFELAQIFDAMSAIGEPLFELSMVQGIDSALGASKYSDQAPIISVLSNAALGYVGQGVPTSFGQVARAIDKTRRQTYYDPNYKGIVKEGLAVGQKQLAKTPGSFLLEPKVDMWGREQENEGGSFVGRLAYNMLSPGYASGNKATAVDKELQSLYKKTGETSVLPSYADKTFELPADLGGEKVKLNAKEYTEYAKTKGGKAYDIFDSVIGTKNWNSLSDDEKVEAASLVYKYANAVAKTKVSDYTLTKMEDGKVKKNKDGDILYRDVAGKIQACEKAGIPAGVTIVAYIAQKDITGDPDRKGNTIPLSASKKKKEAIDKKTPFINKKQRELLYELFEVSEKVW